MSEYLEETAMNSVCPFRSTGKQIDRHAQIETYKADGALLSCQSSCCSAHVGLMSEQHLQAWLMPDAGRFRARVEQQAQPGVLVKQRNPRVLQPERREVQRRQRGGRGRALRQAPQLLDCPVQRAALAVQRAPGALAQLSRMLGMCTGPRRQTGHDGTGIV